MIKTILTALDGSTLSEALLPYVAALAKGFDSDVLLTHVVSQTVLDTLGDSPETWLDLKDLRRTAEVTAREYLDATALGVKELGISVSTRALHGRPAEAILEYAEKEPPDLIAVSTHGRFGLSRVVLGSVAGRILERATCPLVAHPATGRRFGACGTSDRCRRPAG